MSTAAINNIYIDQGADWKDSFTIVGDSNEPIDISGLTGKMQIRETAFSTEILAEVVIEITDALHGEGTRSLTSAQTQAILTIGGSYLVKSNFVNDFYLVDSSNNAVRVSNGLAVISPGVTR